MPATRESVVSVLQEYRAYEIPLHVLGTVDPTYDEEVREDLVDSLWTITHPEVVARLIGEDAEHVAGPDDADEYWRNVFNEDYDEEYTLAYQLLTLQHSIAQRVSVLLEREGDAITHFKVYGFGMELYAKLAVLIGYPTRRPQDPELGPYMTPGDITDPLFQEYLLLMDQHGVI